MISAVAQHVPADFDTWRMQQINKLSEEQYQEYLRKRRQGDTTQDDAWKCTWTQGGAG